MLSHQQQYKVVGKANVNMDFMDKVGIEEIKMFQVKLLEFLNQPGLILTFICGKKPMKI